MCARGLCCTSIQYDVVKMLLHRLCPILIVSMHIFVCFEHLRSKFFAGFRAGTNEWGRSRRWRLCSMQCIGIYNTSIFNARSRAHALNALWMHCSTDTVYVFKYYRINARVIFELVTAHCPKNLFVMICVVGFPSPKKYAVVGLLRLN